MQAFREVITLGPGVCIIRHLQELRRALIGAQINSLYGEHTPEANAQRDELRAEEKAMPAEIQAMREGPCRGCVEMKGGCGVVVAIGETVYEAPKILIGRK